MKKTLFILLLLTSCQVFEVRPSEIVGEYKIEFLSHHNKILSSWDSFLDIKELYSENYLITVIDNDKSIYSKIVNIQPISNKKAVGKIDKVEVFWFDFTTDKFMLIDENINANN